jgi:hypothetical protein
VSEDRVVLNRKSQVNGIPGVSLGEDGFVRTAYGSYNPVTGEGLPIDAPAALMEQILIALIEDGLDTGVAEEFDFDAFMDRKFGGDSVGNT